MNDCLQALKSKIKSLGNPDVNFFLNQYEYLYSKNDIEIVFSGTLSNGKTTLINALLGYNILSTGIGAVTTFLTFIRRCNTEKIIVKYKNGHIEEDVLSKDKLQEINKGDNIEMIEVCLDKFPFPNVKFVDTPGIGDINLQREYRSVSYVPLADAMVFVIDVSRGLTKEEKEFFEGTTTKSNKDRIFIVLNKIDAVEELEDYESVVKKILPNYITDNYPVYPVSALRYLSGVLTNNEEKIKNSKVVKFKTDLETYISNLDKNKVISERKKKALDAIKNLSFSQIDSLIENSSRNLPGIKEQLIKSQQELESALLEKKKVEQELENIYLHLKDDCIKNSLENLKTSIFKALDDVNDKESLIDVFNENMPSLIEEFSAEIKACSHEKLKIQNFEFNEINDLLTLILRNVDDVVMYLIEILSFLPKVGPKIRIFITHEKVRKIIEIFSGKLLEGKVKSEINNLINDIEYKLNDSLNKYIKELKDEYEHTKLGSIRSKIISLEELNRLTESELNVLNNKKIFYEDEKKNIEEMIEKCGSS